MNESVAADGAPELEQLSLTKSQINNAREYIIFRGWDK